MFQLSDNKSNKQDKDKNNEQKKHPNQASLINDLSLQAKLAFGIPAVMAPPVQAKNKANTEDEVNNDPMLEQEANELGVKAAQGLNADVSGDGSGIQKQDDGNSATTDTNNTGASNDPLETTLGLSASVGAGGTNNDADLLIVKNKLIEYGFLNAGEATQEQINDAIGNFQSQVLGINPDKNIGANGKTDRALATYYSPVKSETDYDTIETTINNDFSHSVVKRADDFESSFSATSTINSASTALTIDLNALMALRTRLNDFGNSFSNETLNTLAGIDKQQLTDEQKEQINTCKVNTLNKLKSLQKKKKIMWWSNKKSNVNSSLYVLTGNSNKASYTEKQIAKNDATYLYLVNHKKHTFEWTKEDNTTKTLELQNMVRSGHTSNMEGMSYVGTEKPKDMADSEFQSNSGLDESRSKALKEASTHEGNFDALNTYDKAKVSVGFIQFAGGNRSIEYLFAKLKLDNPSTFQACFGKYGIDVEFRTNSSNRIIDNSCRIIVHDHTENKTLRGLEAEDLISTSPIYSAILIKAGANTEVKKAQLAVAKEKYVDRPENTKLRLSIKVLKVNTGDTPTIYEGSTAISEYKQTESYTSNNTNGNVVELDLDLSNLKIGDIMQSSKERAALYGTYINVPGWSITAVKRAVKAIVIKDELTTVDQVKAIDPKELLESMKSNSYHYDKNNNKVEHTEHQSRIQSALDSDL